MLKPESEYTAILLCGGMGTRLADLIGKDTPKSLVKVGGKELLAHSLDTIEDERINRYVFAIGHQADKIKQWVGRRAIKGAISFSQQSSPGVIGAIKSATEGSPAEGYVVCNTDELRLGFSISDAIDYHENHPQPATISATVMADVYRHRLLELRGSRVVGSRLKPTEFLEDPSFRGPVNMGALVLDTKAFDYIDPSLGNGWSSLIEPLHDNGQLMAYVNGDAIYCNVGTPGEYREAEFRAGEFSSSHPPQSASSISS